MASLKEAIINAVAASAAIGAGGAIVTGKIDLARHDERIQRIEKLDAKMDRLSERLDRFSVDLARVETKQEAHDVPRQ
jgi:outer membrane murein-binding lipoprotein Lpp